MQRSALLMFLNLCLAVPAHLAGQVDASTLAGLNGGASENVLRPGDLVRITVWPAAELGGDYPIEASGLVYLPMLGEFRAAGIPLDALRADLRARLGEAMKTPVVTVVPVFKVSILGEVGSPGLYAMETNQTIFDVVSMAGGFTDMADRSTISLIRDERTYEIDTETALATGGGSLNLPIHSGDRILVPRRTRISFGNVLTVLQMTITVLTLYNVVTN